MSENWSINPDTRNPNRLQNILRVLKEFEGKTFNTEIQKNFFRRLIKKKLYVPKDVKNNTDFAEAYSNEEIPENDLDKIMSYVKRHDLRGRGKAAPMNQFGFAIARERSGEVVITDLGNYFISEEAELDKIFLRVLLKWQFPNPLDRSFRAELGYNLVPFTVTLKLIKKLNEKCRTKGLNPVGISKEEFGLFLLTLKSYDKIEDQVNKIIDFRKEQRRRSSNERKEWKRNYINREVIRIFSLSESQSEEISKKWANLKTYTDTVIRYFRLTKYVYLRGNGFYVDLSPERKVEIQRIDENFTGEAIMFEGEDVARKYIEYLSNSELPVLPWENTNDYNSIITKLTNEIDKLKEEIEKRYSDIPFEFSNVGRPELIDNYSNNAYIEKLRNELLRLKNFIEYQEAQKPNMLSEYIKKLKELCSREYPGNAPIDLEWYSCLTLKSLNDAIEIRPNYPVGDDNVPTFTAPSGKVDIEGYYSDFIIGLEVTMLRDRSQWYNEGQPVQRHIKELQKRNEDSNIYCIFIAPLIHIDTLETFWMADKHGYQGRKMKIIPLTIEQYVSILKRIVEAKKQGIFITNVMIKKLLNKFIQKVDSCSNSQEWIRSFNEIINSFTIEAN